MKQNQYAIIGGVAGLFIAYPLSYFLQPSALRAKVSLGKYIEIFKDVVGSKDLQSTVIISFIIAIAVGTAIGFLVGQSADKK